jgi:hypothetical protein
MIYFEYCISKRVESHPAARQPLASKWGIFGDMTQTKQVRRSVALPTRVAERVERIARKRHLSDNRVLVELVEQGLAAQKEKERAFFALAERFRAAADPEEIKRLGDEMGRFIFGE